MTINPADLPDGTVVEVIATPDRERREFHAIISGRVCRWVAADRDSQRSAAGALASRGDKVPKIVRTFSPDPTPDQEVPREEWASIKPGSRVRVERADGVTVVGVLSYADSEDFLIGDAPSHNVDPRHVARVYLLDEPTDPDADLVQAVADALSDYDGTTDFSWEDMARAALAVVREADQ